MALDNSYTFVIYEEEDLLKVNYSPNVQEALQKPLVEQSLGEVVANLIHTTITSFGDQIGLEDVEVQKD